MRERVVRLIKCSAHFTTGDYVYVHGAAATPLPLLESLAAHGKSEGLKDVNLIHIHTEGPGVCQQPEYEGMLLCPYDKVLLE